MPVEFPNLSPDEFEELTTALANDGAGWQISGASGSGKSKAMENMFMTLVRRRGRQAIFFDPHGESAKALWRMVQTLPKRIRGNVLYIRPSDLRTVVGINPLHVPRNGLTDYEWRARLANKVSHTALILLAAFGETAFGARPVLRKWVTRWLRTLAYVGLSISDVQYFIDVRSDLYQELVQLVPDVLARNEMAELPRLRLHELENEIASAKNRFLGMLENPACESVLGRNRDCLDMHQLIADGTSLIVDLEPAGVLSADDQQLLCNLYLNEFLHAVINIPDEQRRPCWCFIDELAVFQTSQNLLLNMLCEIRKFKTRFILAHQGSSRFPGGQENEFLKTIMAQCRVHLYFRHAAHDAVFFSGGPALSSYDPLKVKHEQRQDVQIHDGVDIIELQGRSSQQGETETDGGSEVHGTTAASTWGVQEGESTSQSEQSQLDSLRSAVTRATNNNYSTREGGSHSETNQKGRNWSTARTSSHGWSVNQTTVPKFRVENVVQSVTFFTSEEQCRLIAQKVVDFSPGEGLLHIGGKGTWIVQLPLPVDRLARTPRARAKAMKEAHERLMARPEFTTPEQIQHERCQTLSALIREVRNILRHSDRRDENQVCLNLHSQPVAESISSIPETQPGLTNTPPTKTEDTNAPWDI
ncbi:MAG: type IV secretion system DNA-binding domain-containing protein [Planctomycetaceae bacterium]|nr:type IV secretion system DNA-binding domain-containing protein [Planctomycetaceae bacterium]